MANGRLMAWPQHYNGAVSTMYQKSLVRANARKTITRNAHTSVLRLHTDGVPEQHRYWHYDLRRQRLCIYGGLLRFIDACVAAGKPEIARQVVRFLDAYITECEGPTETAALKIAA